jgi:hypothetical protein
MDGDLLFLLPFLNAGLTIYDKEFLMFLKKAFISSNRIKSHFPDTVKGNNILGERTFILLFPLHWREGSKGRGLR